MWKIALVLGVAILLVGVLVAVVPLVPVPSGNKTVGEGNFAYFQVNSLLLPQQLAITWSASKPVEIWVEDCGSSEPAADSLEPCHSPVRGPDHENGTGGVLGFSANNGDWVAIGTDGTNASISLKTTDAQGALGAFVLAATLIFLGIYWRRSERREAAAKSGAPEAPEPSSSSGSEEGKEEGSSEPTTSTPAGQEASPAVPAPADSSPEGEKAAGTR